MKHYSFVIYDLDGTLIDTSPGVRQAVIRTIKELHLEMLSDETIEKFVGPPMQDSFVEYYGLDKKRSLDAANLFRDNYKKYSLFEGYVYPGIIDLLKLQRNQSINIAVGTNKSHENAVAILNYFGISEFCTFIKGADRNGVLSKADIINICIEEMKADKSETLYIGDSLYDSSGAATANVDFMAVTYGFGFHSVSDLNGIKNIGICNTVSSLIDFFRTQ